MGDSRDARADAAAEAARAKAMRPWYKKKRFIIPLGLFALLVIGSLASGGGETSDRGASGATDEASEPETTTAGLNQPVQDGKFQFTVKGVECDITTVGDQFLNTQAQGQFCVLSVNVKNVGTEAQSLFGGNQKLFDAQGREFSADSEAAIYAADSKALFEQINPGNSIDGQIYFDVPQDATPVRAELHDSAFSGGVAVDLR